jgi:hypothetical protein
MAENKRDGKLLRVYDKSLAKFHRHLQGQKRIKRHTGIDRSLCSAKDSEASSISYSLLLAIWKPIFRFPYGSQTSDNKPLIILFSCPKIATLNVLKVIEVRNYISRNLLKNI